MIKRHKKILWVVGCRPNFIKLFKHPNQVVVHTGQHYDKEMSDIFFKKMDLPVPKYNLCCTRIGETLDKLMDVMLKENPDYVMVMGDTNSSLAGALTAAYCKIPVIHLEAGMRSFNKYMPEEINRILIDKLSDIFFVPGEIAENNLRNDGIRTHIYNVGSNICDRVITECPTKEVKGFKKNSYRVLTLHRQSNVDVKEIFKLILNAINKSGEFFVWPIHPRAKKRLDEFKLKLPQNIKIIEPVDHKKMIHLMAFSNQIVTDSGGIQVEAYFLRKPCITIRTETEWLETVYEGWNYVTGLDEDVIMKAIKTHLIKPNHHSLNSYRCGDSNKIIKELLSQL